MIDNDEIKKTKILSIELKKEFTKMTRRKHFHSQNGSSG